MPEIKLNEASTPRIQGAFCGCCGEPGLWPIGTNKAGEVEFRCTGCGDTDTSTGNRRLASMFQRSADSMDRLARSLGLAKRSTREAAGVA